MRAVAGLFTRRFMASAMLLLAGAGALGFYLWLRDSSLVQVEHVKISGLTTRDAPAIKRTLRQAALRMTTLHYDAGALERAVNGFPAVESVSASADLPDTLEIRVREHRPVAALESGDGRRIAVASDGTLLPRTRRGALPTVKVDAIPNVGRLDGQSPEEVLVQVLAGAPAELRPLLERAYRAADGIRVAMRQGPTLRFGAPRRVAAKWAAVTRVMADPSAGGAVSLDVRLPDRPAATFDTEPAAVPEAPADGAGAAPTGPTGATGPTGPTDVTPPPAPAPAVPEAATPAAPVPQP
jgi:cell division protein FtsQ